MNFRRRRLASVLGLEGRDALFNLTAPLRVFLAKLIADPLNLKTFEEALCVEFIARAITEFFHVTPQRRLEPGADLLRPVQGVEFLASDAIGFACAWVAVSHRHPGAQRARRVVRHAERNAGDSETGSLL